VITFGRVHRTTRLLSASFESGESGPTHNQDVQHYSNEPQYNASADTNERSNNYTTEQPCSDQSRRCIDNSLVALQQPSQS
ncbi:MAG: hypothetical protein ACRED4_07745, partial [Brevundimonas sp.]